jgi:DNA polymerase delta subunit 2
VAVSKSEKEIYAYNRQYSHVYDHRLVALKKRCWNAINKSQEEEEQQKSTTASAAKPVKCVLELLEDVPSLLVGTLIKESTNEGGDGSANKKTPLLHSKSKCRDSDQLYLEDDSGRVALQVDSVHEYCTGTVMGVRGTVDKAGTFRVTAMYPPEPVPHPKTLSATPVRMEPSVPLQSAPHLLLVSGLYCGDANVSSLTRDMLLAYLQGHFTPDAQKVCRVIVCGGGPSAMPTSSMTNGDGNGSETLNDPSPSSSVFGIRELDAWGLQLGVAGIPVDILPSKYDPTTANWPQRPFHSSLFPKASATRLWNQTPNPYAAGHGSRMVIGTDGENIRDLRRSILLPVEDDRRSAVTGVAKEEMETVLPTKYRPISELEALKRTLAWGHICPTGPDSVPTVPHAELDPMVLESTPHLYFSGNAAEFATELVKDATVGIETRLVCVPQFAETGQAVLVNLETLGVEVLQFEDSPEN